MVIFLILAVLQFLYIFHFNRLKNALLKSFVFGVVYGIFLELIQDYFIDSRVGDVSDVIANTIGTFTGIIIMWIVLSYKNKISDYFIENTSD